ncbi:ATP-binding protein [Prevotella sp. E15-22]|uniref:AAA family ATPase n=1 Tax=Prevotella sp. E15-22 TaxID=2937774 RepID=UPI0020578D14|nr:AAA family ATPase [Prevotella sp. E15-22]UPS45241.1 ATP-binding protein [Prevotella sp. E15-22]
MSDYHAVRSADIVVDGLTILAGENGCGKSTLSRWLYYLVNGVQQFDRLVIKDYVEKVERLIRQQRMAAREMRYYIQSRDTSSNRSISDISYNSVKQFKTSDSDEDIIQQCQENFALSIHNLSDLIVDFLNNTKSGVRRDRILAYLKIDANEAMMDSHQVAENFVDKNLRLLRKFSDQLYVDLEKRSFECLMKNICHEYEEDDNPPQSLHLFEDDVDLIDDGRVSSLFSLQRAIYVDTPMALTNDYAENVFWRELRNLVQQSKQELGLPEKKLLRRIKNILHGEAKMVKVDSPFDEEELRFVSDDGKVNIEIEKAATGFKTFTYLQRLLENGFLGDKCLLLIDEPEAHLHPQWIVEYARILVLLHKELGLKIMVATHNPDMVAALKSIAEREQVLDKTHFYIAKSSENSYGYDYKDLGGDVSEIFKSFNIALSRIESYGTSSL